MNQWAMLGLCSVLGALLLAVEHWAPWGRKLKRIERYLLGSVAVWLSYTIWLWTLGQAWLALGLLAIYALGGVTVWMCYFLDEHKTNGDKVKITEILDEDL